MYLSTNRLVASLLGAALTLVGPGALAAEGPDVGCEACIVVDDEGRTLWSRQPHAALPNASTTKMVSALLVIQEADLEDRVTTSSAAAATGGGGLDLQPGDTYTVEALLHALLMSSSNDAAVALAEHVAGSEAAFVEDMNRLADRLGADDSSFVTPHGLDVPGHAASPADLATFGLELLDDPVLAEIVATPDTTITGSRGTELLENTNLLLESYRGAIGVKTGMTALAGEVLVAAARRRGSRVIAVAMRSLDAASDASELLDFGFRRLAEEVVLPAGTVVTEVVLDPAGTVEVATSREIRALPPEGGVKRNVVLDPTIRPELRQGERVGTLELVANGKVLARTPLVSTGATEAPEPSMLQSFVEALMSFVYAAGRALGVA